MHDFNKIKEYSEIVEKAILDKFPGGYYTIKILLWDDDTSRVTCTHGDGKKIHNYVYYQDKLSYEVSDDIRSQVMILDEFGKEHFYELKEVTNLVV